MLTFVWFSSLLNWYLSKKCSWELTMFFGRWVWLLAYELVATYMWIWCNGNMTAFPWCSLKVKLLM